MKKFIRNKFLNITLVVVLLLVIFIIDLSLPLGVAGGVPYIAVVFLSTWLFNVRYVLLVGVLTSFMVLSGYILSPLGGVLWVVVVNRVLAFFAIWITALVGVNWIKSQNKLYDAKYAGEDRIRLLLDSTAEAIIGVDLECKCTFANPASAELLGFDGEKDILGLNACDITLGLDNLETRETEKCIFNKVMKTGIGIYEDLSYFYKKDNSPLPVEIRIHPILSKYGTIIGAVGTFFDVTEKKKMEDELLKSQKLKSLGVLAGGIAHDFNNMLTVIMGNISLLKEQSDKNSSSFNMYCGIEESAINAGKLTKQLLTFSKGGAPVKEITDLGNLLEEAVTFALRGTDIDYENNISENLHAINADKGQVHQVINNLIINASQAMDRGGLLKVSAENCQSEEELPKQLEKGEYVKFVIKDSGKGIEESIIQNIYDPYFTTKNDGSGLGLASVYAIIKKHGGYIDVESVVGLGAEFTVYLPASTEKVAKPKVKKTEGLKKGLKVLLMDDDEMIRAIVGQFLYQLDCDCELVSEGASAIDSYKNSLEENKPFDLVILDLTIRDGMGGEEAIKELCKLDSDVKVIASTGYSDSSVISNYKEHGFSGVLLKPYVMTDFVQAINDLEL